MQERNNRYTKDYVDANQLAPLEQFRDWIEKPENLDLWMQYPLNIGDEKSMRYQAHEVINHPGEASPKVIFNVAIKLADLAGYDGDDRNAAYIMLGAYTDGLTALSRCNRFTVQEHGHYWNALTTLLNSQSIFVQQGERKMALQATRRTRPPGR